jgi:TP901 family phage tail tape measure protein
MAINAGDIIYRVTGDTSALQQDMANAEGIIKGRSTSITSSLSTIGAGMTALGAAIVAPMALGVKAASEFQTAMANVYTLGVQDNEKLSNAIRALSVEYGVNMVQAANAAYQAISAGATEVTAPQVLAEAAKAAAAGVTDMTTSIELGMGMVNAFGLELTDMSGVYDAAFVAVRMGVTTFEQLGQNAGKASASFASAKLTAEEMFGAVAAMTKGNVGTAESFTQLNAVVAGFIRQGEIGKLQTLGLQGALAWLMETTGGNQQEMLKFLGSTEALNAVMMLAGTQAQSFSDIMGMMAEKTGATQEAFDIVAEHSPAFAFAQLQATIQDLMITVGEALLPALAQIVDCLKPVIMGLAEWMKANSELTSTILIVGAAVGGLMVVIGPLLMALPGIIALFTAVAAVMSGPVALGIGAVVAGGAILYTFWEQLGPIVTAGAKILYDNVMNMISPFTMLLDIANACAQAVGGLFGIDIPDFSWNGVKDALGFAAAGGPVNSGKPYIVGERGPELMIPQVNGRIATHSQTADMLAGAGAGAGVNVEINMSGFSVSSDYDVKRIASELGAELRNRLTGIGYAATRRRI